MSWAKRYVSFSSFAPARGKNAQCLGLLGVDLEPELRQPRELDLLQHDPIARDNDAGIPHPLLLVPVLPPEASSLCSSASTPCSSSAVLLASSLRASTSVSRRSSTSSSCASCSSTSTAVELTRSSEVGQSSSSCTSSSTPLRRLGSVDKREARLVLVVEVRERSSAAGSEGLLGLTTVLAHGGRSSRRSSARAARGLSSGARGRGRSLRLVPVDDAAELVVLGEGGVGDAAIAFEVSGEREARDEGTYSLNWAGRWSAEGPKAPSLSTMEAMRVERLMAKLRAREEGQSWCSQVALVLLSPSSPSALPPPLAGVLLRHPHSHKTAPALLLATAPCHQRTLSTDRPRAGFVRRSSGCGRGGGAVRRGKTRAATLSCTPAYLAEVWGGGTGVDLLPLLLTLRGKLDPDVGTKLSFRGCSQRAGTRFYSAPLPLSLLPLSYLKRSFDPTAHSLALKWLLIPNSELGQSWAGFGSSSRQRSQLSSFRRLSVKAEWGTALRALLFLKTMLRSLSSLTHSALQHSTPVLSRSFSSSRNTMSASFQEAVKARRSIYALSASSPISDSAISECVHSAVKHSPTSFNSQSSRAVLLLGEEHAKVRPRLECQHGASADAIRAGLGLCKGRHQGHRSC